jgi:hypothetical protein
VDISKPYAGRQDARLSQTTDSSLHALPGIRQRYQNTLCAAADEHCLRENPVTTGHPLLWLCEAAKGEPIEPPTAATGPQSPATSYMMGISRGIGKGRVAWSLP